MICKNCYLSQKNGTESYCIYNVEKIVIMPTYYSMLQLQSDNIDRDFCAARISFNSYFQDWLSNNQEKWNETKTLMREENLDKILN